MTGLKRPRTANGARPDYRQAWSGSRYRIAALLVATSLSQATIATASPQDNQPAGSVTQGGGYSIPWHTLDSGGTVSATGGGWTLAGTVGQFDATQDNALSAGNWSLTAGFWARRFDLDDGDTLFSDRFENP